MENLDQSNDLQKSLNIGEIASSAKTEQEEEGKLENDLSTVKYNTLNAETSTKRAKNFQQWAEQALVVFCECLEDSENAQDS